MDSRLIERIEKTMNGTMWRFLYDEEPPLIDIPQLYGNVEIEIHGDDYETIYADIYQFMRKYDFRVEAWKSAEKRRDGKLKVNNTLKKRMADSLDAWYNIYELERKMMREIWPRYFDTKFDLTVEEINIIREIAEKNHLEFVSILRPKEILHFIESKYYQNVAYRFPLRSWCLLKAGMDARKEYENFDIEKETLGCLIESCQSDDIKSPEAEQIKESLNMVKQDLLNFSDGIDSYHSNKLFDEMLKDEEDDQSEE